MAERTMDYEIIDCNAFFGFSSKRNLDMSIDSLKKIMDKYQRLNVIILSTVGIQYDYQTGNEETLSVCKQEGKRFLPAASIDPRRYFGCKEEVERRVKQGFKLFRFFPDSQGWPLEFAPFQKILEEINRFGKPVMIPAAGYGLPTQVTKLIKDLEMPIILTSISYCNLSEALVLMKDYPQIYVETHLLNSPDAIEIVTSEVGCERLVFGSNSPLSYFSSAFLPILYADINQEEKSKILGENILKLIGDNNGAYH